MSFWRDNALLHCMQLLGADGVAVGQYHRIGKGPHCAADIRDQNGNWSTYIMDSASEAQAKILEVTGCQVQQEEDMVNKRNNSWKGEGPSAESSDAKAEPLEAADVNVRAMTNEEESALTVQTGVTTYGAGEHPPKRTRKPRGTGKPRGRKPKNANGLGAQADAYLKRYTELKQHVTAAEAALQAHADSVNESVIRAARALSALQNEEVES